MSLSLAARDAGSRASRGLSLLSPVSPAPQSRTVLEMGGCVLANTHPHFQFISIHSTRDTGDSRDRPRQPCVSASLACPWCP